LKKRKKIEKLKKPVLETKPGIKREKSRGNRGGTAGEQGENRE